MAQAVTIVTSGGLPVTDVASVTGLAQPMTLVTSGGRPVTVLSSGGLPVVLVDEAGALAYLLSVATNSLGVAPYHYWDFTTNRALFASSDVGTVTSTPGWSFTRASTGTYVNSAGVMTTFASGEPRIGDRGLLIEGARTNLFLNSNVGSTQSVTVTAAAHTLSFYGTGTITLSGTSTAGPLVGTGANDRVTLTFTPTAGTLTLTVSGSCTLVQLELGAFVSSYIATTGSSATRAADVALITSPGLTYPVSLFSHVERVTDTGGNECHVALDTNIATTDETLLYVASADTGSILTSIAGTQASISGGAFASGTTKKLAARIATNDVQVALNANLGTADTLATNPTTPTRLRFGSRVGGVGFCYDYIQRIAIFNSALSNAELQTATT